VRGVGGHLRHAGGLDGALPQVRHGPLNAARPGSRPVSTEPLAVGPLTVGPLTVGWQVT